jgi:hypothetical protein
MFLRGPHDVINLAVMVGMTEERAKDAITINCDKVIENAEKRRTGGMQVMEVEVAAASASSMQGIAVGVAIGAASASSTAAPRGGSGDEDEGDGFVPF